VNWLDLILIVILALSTIQSFRKGFSREIIGLAASLAALILAMWFYAFAGSFVSPYVGSQRIANLVGFFLVVVGVLLVGVLVGIIVSRFIRTIGLSFFDRLLGATFGLIRGFLVATALLTAFIAFGPHAETDTAPSAVVHSQLAPYVLEASRYFVAIAPMDLKQSFHKRYTRIEAALEKPSRSRGNEDF
jgi:membrane protein required for colicin V production